MKYENYIRVEFPSKSANEGLARSVVGVFASQLDPTMEELGDVKTAVAPHQHAPLHHFFTHSNVTVLEYLKTLLIYTR